MIPKSGNRFSDKIMPTEKNDAPVTASEVNAIFSDLKLFPALVLAVSGGPDSTALMVLAARWRGALKSGPKLIAVTVDHGLRKQAKREAADVARLARKLGIAHRTLRWSGRKPKTGSSAVWSRFWKQPMTLTSTWCWKPTPRPRSTTPKPSAA